MNKEEKKKRTAEELEKCVLELEKKAAERDEYYDKYVRSQAEYENAKKRMEKDKEDFVRFANESIISELFPILDSFDSAMNTIEKTEKDKNILDGLKMLQDKFHKVLEDNGLSVMTTVGEKFDPIKHEAVMKVSNDKFQDGFIAEEVRKGYMLNGKVLRPAMVKVAVKEEEEKEVQNG